MVHPVVPRSLQRELQAALDAVKGYLTHSAPGGALDHLLEQERILFCTQSRLLATLWVRSERGRYQGTNPMPDRLAGSCTTMEEALAICEATDPTLLITTQLLEVGSGLELVVEAKRRQPQLRTLLFLQYDHRALLVEAIKTHSDGIVLESEMGSGHVITALRTVSQGGFYLEPRIGELLHGSEAGHDPGLSKREMEVMQEVANGLSDREIGVRLGVTTETVKFHLKQIYQKLHVHNRTRAAVSMVLLGLVKPPRPLLPDLPAA